LWFFLGNVYIFQQYCHFCCTINYRF
jgi:hypothetical protein